MQQHVRCEYAVEKQNPTSGLLETVVLGRGVFLADKSLEIYPIGVLCAAVNRTRDAIKKWEVVCKRQFFRTDPETGVQEAYEATFAVIPRAQYTVPGSRCRRWYTRAQVDAVARALVAHGATKGATKVDWWSIATDIEETFK